ncbi:MAG: 1-deoxy-D-xylulose-5-phosphate synthase [Chlamydiia bacterium]|nr:1-deoxy-D-xylulose-5-phosphate synthase [Chlamydiia bacterium]MCH9615814.1 1-deoxy-D-xylulose-5-phosphate synthase [Chlamydiia bacterium]MCH9628783.1 1-deoxy-D-xylulose-5-phosphate synthase [Chlamydiia bacterium]
MSYKSLSEIDQPADIKDLSIDGLAELAKEIRERIKDVLSVTGGHLASNLGIVELTLAMHKVFDSPLDKFIFDVSHQTYPHKMLTGRNALLEQLRQFNGLCGFSHPKESAHDHFFAGHAATAISLALGVAKQRDLSFSKDYVLPVIGDATLTCGLALEALNNIPSHLKRFIIVLNDNAMSISKNVGHINDILPDKDKCRDYFELFGLSYEGPIDGHDLSTLVPTLEKLKSANGPILLHVKTVKGKGMETAILNPTTYHGAKPFDKITGKFHPAPAKPTFPKVFGKHMLTLANRDPSLVCVTPAMPAGSCINAFMEKYPDRCLDVGIAEGHAVTFAAGIASNRKMKVVTSIYSTFLQRAVDNVFHDVCLQGIPVVFALDRSGIAGPDGSTHNGIYDISFLNAMPNMVIAQPRDGHVLKELLESAFTYNRPTAIRYPNLATEEYDAPIRKRPLGQAEVMVSGEDLCILSLGHTVKTALKVRDGLGSNATVIDAVFAKPLDSDLLLDILSSHKYLITIEEHALSGGFGSIINTFVLRNGLSHLQVLNFGIPDTFVEHGKHQNLVDSLGMSAEQIVKKVKQEFSLRENCAFSPQR